MVSRLPPNAQALCVGQVFVPSLSIAILLVLLAFAMVASSGAYSCNFKPLLCAASPPMQAHFGEPPCISPCCVKDFFWGACLPNYVNFCSIDRRSRTTLPLADGHQRDFLTFTGRRPLPFCFIPCGETMLCLRAILCRPLAIVPPVLNRIRCSCKFVHSSVSGQATQAPALPTTHAFGKATSSPCC